MSLKSYLVKAFHLFAAVQFFYGLYYEVIHVLPEELKLRKFRFDLWFINILNQCTYFAYFDSFGGKLIYLTCKLISLAFNCSLL